MTGSLLQYLAPLNFARFAILAVVVCSALPSRAQELQPRWWGHLPIGSNFGGSGYAYTTGDIAFDPVLRIENAEMEIHTYPLKYIRTFELLGKTARIDWLQTYQDARWEGLLDDAPASTARSGWSDMNVRFAVNLLGAPPLSGAEFKEYRSQIDHETIMGVGVVVQLPTGQYLEDKLLNLGTNRFTVRPQMGIMHNRGKWSSETTAASWIYTDNNDFFNDNYLEQDPLFTLQSHLNYTFRPGLWIGAGIGVGVGGTSTINNVDKHDDRENLGWVCSVGIPINRQLGIKLTYIGLRTQVPVGSSSDTLAASMSALW